MEEHGRTRHSFTFHRSYLVSLAMAISLKTASRQYALSMEGVVNLVPVAGAELKH